MTISWESILHDIDVAKERLAAAAGERTKQKPISVHPTMRCIGGAADRDGEAS